MRQASITALAVAMISATALGQQPPAPATGRYAAHAATAELESVRAEFESEIAELRQLLADSEAGGGCGAGCNPCCRSQGWFGSAQAVWLKPHHTDGTGFAQVGGNVETDAELSPRLELGYARCDGLGWRVRYWEYDHAFVGGHPMEPFGIGWDTWVGDFEVVDSTALGCDCDATFSLGYRHVEYAETLDGGGPIIKAFEGDGLTASVELRCPLTCGWGLFANTRGSALYGEEDLSFLEDDVVSFAFHQEANVKYIWEAQAGIEWIRCHPCGGYWFARAFGEVQYWDAFGIGLVVNDSGDFARDSSVGFAGFGFSLGVVR